MLVFAMATTKKSINGKMAKYLWLTHMIALKNELDLFVSNGCISKNKTLSEKSKMRNHIHLASKCQIPFVEGLVASPAPFPSLDIILYRYPRLLCSLCALKETNSILLLQCRICPGPRLMDIIPLRGYNIFCRASCTDHFQL